MENFLNLTYNDIVFLLSLTLAVVVFNVYLFYDKSDKKLAELAKKKELLKSQNKGKIILLCDGDEEVDSRLTQVYGDIAGGTVFAGMTIEDHRGIKYVIKEVYGDDKNPDVPNKEVKDGENVAIIFETNHWNSKSFREQLKKDKIVPLVIR